MIMDFILPYAAKWFLVFLRAGIVIMLLPFLGSTMIPAQVKIGLAAAVAVVLAPVVPAPGPFEAAPALVLREVLFGIAIGSAARFVFIAVEAAGQMISGAMGLSLATAFNPDIGQSTEAARLLGMIAMLLFLATDSHHDLIVLFARSYELAPALRIDAAFLTKAATEWGGRLFVLTVKLSAPIVVASLLTNLLLGFLARTAPQLNVFFVGYPVYLFVGFLLLLTGMPVFIHETTASFATVRDGLLRIMAGMGR